MSGERDLHILLSSLQISIADEMYVFATLKDGIFHDSLAPRMTFREAEGLTVIITQEQAEAHGIAYEFESRMITLNVHSSLEAVGFMALISAKLADADIPVNPVAGFYHDHLFVPAHKLAEAKAVLSQIATR